MKTSVLIPTAGDIVTVREHAALADQLGYDSVNCSHIAARDSFTTLADLAHLAPSVTLATAVAPIYHRSPASMAQTAATVDDLSGGRFRLGLGTGHRATMGGWHGQDIGNPVAEMREYVSLVRALLAGDEPPTGLRWSSSFAFNGFKARADIPIYLAALSPAMLRLAGEIADGVVLWACPASYVGDVVTREVAAGRARAGRDLAGFDVCAAIPSAVVADPAVAYRGIRAELHRYFGLPFYRAMFAQAGYGADIAAYDAAAGSAAQRAAISDAFIEDLCAIGKPEDVAAGVARFRAAGATNPMITNITGTDLRPALSAAVGALGPSEWSSPVVRGGRCQVVDAVFTGVRDQEGRSAVDVFGQHFDGPVRVAGKGELPELPVFPGQVALMIVREHPVPAAVELGTVPERVGDRLEPAVAAAGQQGLMEVAVVTRPVLADRSVIPGDRRPLQAVVRGQDPRLPLQVAALDRQAQGERFDLDTGLGQLGDVLDRQVANPEAALRRSDQQVLLSQPGERLPDDRLADPESFGELDHLQLLAGMKDSVEQLGPYHFVHLFGASYGGRHPHRVAYFSRLTFY
jgi:alkanesulfonate monooxygenase SsuD/methylene tetrahydromethanopterin reductase-like flavin-dependent oxidoreductase (luciferase family)